MNGFQKALNYGTPTLCYVNLFQYMRCILRYVRCILHYMRCPLYYMHCFSYNMRCLRRYMWYICHYLQRFCHYIRCFRHYCWFSVSRNSKQIKINIKTVQKIKSRIWEIKGGTYTKTLAKIQVRGIFRIQDIRRNVLPKLIEICMETPCWCSPG